MIVYSYFGISSADLLYIQEEGLYDSNAELVVRLFEKKAESERLKKQQDRSSRKLEPKSVALQTA